jgi:hypothetical protein
MEWMLQVVDEFDDALSALRHQAMGFYWEIGMTLAGIAAMVAMIAAASAAFLKMQGLLHA